MRGREDSPSRSWSGSAALLLALAGLLAAATTVGAATLLEDAAGDAEWIGGNHAAARCAFGTPIVWRECYRLEGQATGVPAPPDRDILAVDAEVQGDVLVVALVVPELREEPMRFQEESGSVDYSVCVGAVCGYANRMIEVESPDIGYMYSVQEGCVFMGVCFWAAETTFEYGSPGRITWQLPLSVVPSTAPAANVTAWVWRWDQMGTEREVFIPLPGMQEGAGFGGAYYLADSAEAMADITVLGLPAMPPPTPALPVTSSGDEGDVDLELDMTSLTLAESPSHLTLTAAFADVAAPARNTYVSGVVGLSDGTLLELAARPSDGAWTGHASACVEYDAGWCTRWAAVRTDFVIVPGSAGSMTWVLGRGDVGAPAAGTRLDVGFAFVQEREDSPAVVEATGAAFWTAQPYDLLLLPPGRLASGTVLAEVAVGGAVNAVADELGDAALPGPVPSPTTNMNTLDLSFLEAQRLENGLTRLTLGVADLADLPVPPSYDAVVYAVGLETELGRFMVGLYRTSTTLEFFCAQDTVVFADIPVDPATVARQVVVGVVTTGAEAAGPSQDRQNAGASITFFAPDTCFAHVSGGDLQTLSLGAGAFVVQNPGRATPFGGTANVDATDMVEFPAPVLLAAASAPVPPVAWYVAPFGVTGFWDMTGIVFAVLVAVVGLLAVARKRSALKRYLAEIERAAAIEQPKARDAALREVGARLKADLMRGRISETHFVLVERHLDVALHAARSAAIRAAFSDLPLSLVETLQRLLDDGDMSLEDHRVFITQLEGTTTLTAQAKAEARERVRRWVAEESTA